MKNEFEQKRFERERKGNFTLIFPFNQISEQLAIDINKSGASGSHMTMNGPNHMKSLINEIKQYYDDRHLFLRGQKRF